GPLKGVLATRFVQLAPSRTRHPRAGPSRSVRMEALERQRAYRRRRRPARTLGLFAPRRPASAYALSHWTIADLAERGTIPTIPTRMEKSKPLPTTLPIVG